MDLNRLARVARAVVAILLLGGVQIASSTQAAPSSSKLAITMKLLPNATVGVEYYAVVAATGGERPYDFSGTGLPEGLAFHYTSDTIAGKTTTPGTYSVIITARDSTLPKPQTSSVTFKLTVVAAKR